MPIVVDASTIIAVAANEPSKARLVELTRGETLLAPMTLFWEIGNAISAMFKQKRITLEQGLALLAECRKIPVSLHEPNIEQALRLAATLNIYAYDGYVIQCARDAVQPVLSLDGGLNHAARRAGVAVLEVGP